MTMHTRRSLLGGIVGAAALLAGCSETTSSASGSFTETTVENQQLIVEFDDSLDAETISVIDPDGEAFAQTSVAAGASRVKFDIGMPYAPGEYRIIAAGSEDTLAETTQEIHPELEIIDVGVGANRLDEMPEELHYPERQTIIIVENQGTGPGGVTRLEFSEGFPNSNRDRDGSGIFDNSSELGEVGNIIVSANSQERFFSSTLPFADFESNCASERKVTNANIQLDLSISDEELDKDIEIHYINDSSGDSCQVEIRGAEDV